MESKSAKKVLTANQTLILISGDFPGLVLWRAPLREVTGAEQILFVPNKETPNGQRRANNGPTPGR